MELYPIEKVNERISYYQNLLSNLKDENLRSINEHLLSFWTNFKSQHYSDEKTKS